MSVVSWYFAESGAKHVRQSIVRLPQASEVPAVVDNLIADQAFMAPNWAATVLFPSGSNVPAIAADARREES